MKAKKILVGIVAIAVLLAVVGYYVVMPMIIKSHLPKPVLINTDNQPTLGNPAAKIHIVTFEDLKCANCARFNKTIFPTIKSDYIDKGIANYTMINLAFVQGSMPAANAARCVYAQNHDAFFAFIDAIFQNQPPETENWATLPTLLSIAEKVPHINTDKLASCMIQSPYTTFINNNLTLARQILTPEVVTPSVFVNGVRVTPLTEWQLKRVIMAVQ